MIDTARHVAYLLKVQAMGRAFAQIDALWPAAKFPQENAYWSGQVHAINDAEHSNEEKTRQLHLLIDTIKGR